MKGVLLLPFSFFFYFLSFFAFISLADVDRRSPVDLGELWPIYTFLAVFWLFGIVDAYLVAARKIRPAAPH